MAKRGMSYKSGVSGMASSMPRVGASNAPLPKKIIRMNAGMQKPTARPPIQGKASSGKLGIPIGGKQKQSQPYETKIGRGKKGARPSSYLSNTVKAASGGNSIGKRVSGRPGVGY